MANLIDNTYFVGDIMLPSKLIDGGDLSNIDIYITQYEPKVLLALLGYDLYKALKVQIDAGSGSYSAPWKNFIEGAEYTVNDHTVEWNGLVNSELTSLIAYYIYFFYMTDLVTDTTRTGEVLPTADNAVNVSPAAKMANAWSKFRELYGAITDGDLTPSAYRYLKEHETDFDLWVFTQQGLVNQFGI